MYHLTVTCNLTVKYKEFSRNSPVSTYVLRHNRTIIMALFFFQLHSPSVVLTSRVSSLLVGPIADANFSWYYSSCGSSIMERPSALTTPQDTASHLRSFTCCATLLASVQTPEFVVISCCCHTAKLDTPIIYCMGVMRHAYRSTFRIQTSRRFS